MAGVIISGRPPGPWSCLLLTPVALAIFLAGLGPAYHSRSKRETHIAAWLEKEGAIESRRKCGGAVLKLSLL